MIPGSIVALITPMLNSGKVDYPALRQLVEWHITSGTNAILVTGTTGEAPTLTEQERKNIVRHTVEQTNKRVPVIVGTGTHCTSTTIKNTQTAKMLGADCVLITTPYYNKPTQHGLYQHYAAINHAVDVPQILYNVPGRTGCDLQAETTIKLSKLNNIVGVKEASGDLARLSAILEQSTKNFLVWTGCDENTDDFIRLGGHGVISVTANIFPQALATLAHTSLNGNHEAAKTLQTKLMPLHNAMFCESNPIPVKWALSHLGKIKAGIRLPLTTLSINQQPVVLAALEQTKATL